MKVLIVCAGNTCRSPMAAGLLRRIADQAGTKAQVRTAGLTHHANTRVADKAVAVMREVGIDISDDYSKPVTPELFAWADVIIPMQREHGAYLLEDDPSLAAKLRFTDYRERRDLLQSLLSRLSFR